MSYTNPIKDKEALTQGKVGGDSESVEKTLQALLTKDSYTDVLYKALHGHLNRVSIEGLVHFEETPRSSGLQVPVNAGMPETQYPTSEPTTQDKVQTQSNNSNSIVADPYYRSGTHDNGPNDSPDKPDSLEEIESRKLADVIIRQNPNIYGAFIDSYLPEIKAKLGNYTDLNSIDSREAVQTWWDLKSKELVRAGFDLQDGTLPGDHKASTATPALQPSLKSAQTTILNNANNGTVPNDVPDKTDDKAPMGTPALQSSPVRFSSNYSGTLSQDEFKSDNFISKDEKDKKE